MAAEREKRKGTETDLFFVFLAVCIVAIASYVFQRTQSDVNRNDHIHAGDMAAPWKDWSQEVRIRRSLSLPSFFSLLSDRSPHHFSDTL